MTRKGRFEFEVSGYLNEGSYCVQAINVALFYARNRPLYYRGASTVCRSALWDFHRGTEELPRHSSSCLRRRKLTLRKTKKEAERQYQRGVSA